MAAPARQAALRALRALRSDRIDLGDALTLARDPLPDTRDRALTTEIVVGPLRWRNAIDYQLQLRSARRLDRLDQDVLDALRLGAYQLLYLLRVPVSAVVNDAVAQVKDGGFRSAAGFANAVLRRLAREQTALTWPRRPTTDDDPDRPALVEHLSVVHSHPAWLVDRWLNRYGTSETETWLAFNNRPPALTLSVNRLRSTREDAAARLLTEGIYTNPTSIAPDGLVVTAGRVIGSNAHQDGIITVQDEASQLIPHLVRASKKHRILDACASPGGKTITLVAHTAPSGLVVASDVRPRRIALLASTLQRCGAGAARIVHISPSGPLPFQPASFERVLVDAPCSGLGTIRRDPDIRWRRVPEDLRRFAETQVDLLLRVSESVSIGGQLIYSTCSTESEENEEVVARFLSAKPEFSPVRLADLSALAPAIAAMSTEEGHLRTTPRFGLEGFFGAVLERRSQVDAPSRSA